MGKILIANDLWGAGISRGRQNLEAKGLTAKIFWNKDLASGLEQLPAMENLRT
jgi:hypothetical protein